MNLPKRHIISRVRRIEAQVFLGLVLTLAAVAIAGQVWAAPATVGGPAARQVLVLNSYTPTYAWTNNIVDGIKSVLGRRDDVELSIDFMDTKKIYTPEYAELLAQVFAKKYAKLHFDLIVSSDDDALNFLLDYRDKLFPNVPVVFCGVNNYRDGRLRGQSLFTGVNEENDYDRNFEWLAKNRPQTKRILFVTDETATSAGYIKAINAVRPKWGQRFDIQFTERLTIDEFRQRLQGLTQDTVVFWAMFMRDKAGVPLSFSQSVKLTIASSPVPVFGLIDIAVSAGAVGGYVTSGFAQGQNAARLGERVLSGEKVESIPIVRQSPNIFIFDYPAMQRWQFPDQSIPEGAIVQNRPVSFYQQYKHYVWAALGGMGLETAVIVFLLLAIRTITSKARRRLRESEERYRSIVEDGSELICRMGRDGILRFANGALGRFTGFPTERLVGKAFSDVLSCAVSVHSLSDSMTQASPMVPIELESTCSNGETRWVLWNCRGFFADDASLTEIQAVGHDVTERRHAAAAIQAANTNLQGVLDGMKEGLVVCDREGKLGKIRSRAATQWFGEPRDGMSLVDYLFDVDGRAKAVFAQAVTQLCEDALPFVTNAEQIPKVIRRRERALRVDCQQILRNGEFAETIFVLADITDMLEQERAERLNRELPAIVGNLLRDREGFESFVQDSTDLLTRISSCDSRTELRRIIHTLKGNTAIYGFEYFASRCHALESTMDLDEGEPNEESIVSLTNAWRESLASFEVFLRGGETETVVLNPLEYQELLERLENRTDHAALLRSVRRWTHPRMDQVLGIYARTVRQLAARFNKEVAVSIADNGLRLPRGEMRGFLSVLVHIVRNAVDHGLETPEERVAAGKPRRGRITIESTVDGCTFVVTVTDDGRGIDWEAIRQRAKALGLPHESVGDLEKALFHEGLSTKREVTDISGRGVGLGAVIDSCRQLGGAIGVKSSLGRGTAFEFRFVLPSLLPGPIRPIVSVRPPPEAERSKVV